MRSSRSRIRQIALAAARDVPSLVRFGARYDRLDYPIHGTRAKRSVKSCHCPIAASTHVKFMYFPSALALSIGLTLLACSPVSRGQAGPEITYLGAPGVAADRFPRAARPVAPVVSDRWRAEDERERVGEAARVIEWLGIVPGMTIADIGAGSGYYTVRLAARVGLQGRILAQDVIPDYLSRLHTRVLQEGLTNVSVGLGEPGDPRLPPRSIDVALLIHMYHEIDQPYALLANLAPSLRPGARIGILDVDDITIRHGTPRALLMCELAAAGYRQVAFHWLLVQPPRSEYLAVFEPPVSMPSPESVRPCVR